jgi:hypothetical protein
MKIAISLVMILSGAFYTSYSIYYVIKGYDEANRWDSLCKTYPTKRLHYIFPSYKVGCWLGEYK